MRELYIGQVDLSNQIGRPATCEYRIIVRTLPPPLACESYGVSVTLVQTGEQAQVPDITVQPERVEELVQRLVAGGVTPCTLREIVEDWL